MSVLDQFRDTIAVDEELTRVASLARRQPADDALVLALSAHLRVRERGESGELNLLRPAQAEALRELYELRGAFLPMRVGSGKTLVTLLAPTLLQAQRPALVLPAALREKTLAEYGRYAHDWRVRLPRIFSYQGLGQPQQERELFDYAPDMLLMDEAHCVRNLDAAVTRRIRRYIEANPSTVRAALSGTLITDQLMDYWHIVIWCLGLSAPVPMVQGEAERWASAVDKEKPRLERVNKGALESLPGGYHEWFRGSRGVVPTPGQDCTASIQVSSWRPTLPEALRDVIGRTAITKMRPDGELLDEWELPDCLCQLAQGFYYVWDPMPPSWWLSPRRAWRSYVRDVLDAQLDGFDSESQIVRALDRAGPVLERHPVYAEDESDHDSNCFCSQCYAEPVQIGWREVTVPAATQPPYAEDGRDVLAAWRDVRDKFTPNPVPRWIDVSPLVQAVESVRQHKAGTLIWTRHRAAGWMLEQLGVPYYGGGTHPEQARPAGKLSMALSIQAHGQGRNLQAWHRNLVLVPMAKADLWEQLAGRTHRQGQKNDTIHLAIHTSIEYHGEVLGRVVAEAKAISRASGFEHKLVIADWIG